MMMMMMQTPFQICACVRALSSTIAIFGGDSTMDVTCTQHFCLHFIGITFYASSSSSSFFSPLTIFPSNYPLRAMLLID